MKYIVECFNDQCLLEAFGVNPSFDVNHKYSQGKSVVLELLSTQKNRIGVIDYDYFVDNDYYDKCEHKIKISNEINVYYEKVNNNYLIVFSKKIESMFVKETIETESLETAKKLGFDNSEGNYHKIGSDKSKYNKLKNLLSTVISRSPNLKALKNYL